MRTSRRALLAAAGATAVGGCLGVPAMSDRGRTLPDDCPVSQDLGVEWPAELTAESVEAFLESYEHVYYRDVVVEYESASTVDSYGLSVHVSEGPTPVDDGYRATLYGGGGVYTPTLHLGAVADPPAGPPSGADVVPIGEVEDRPLRDLLEDAAAEGEAELHVDRPGEPVDRYIERVAELSADFDPLTRPGDSGRAFFDVDGTIVELTVSADRFHGDHGWRAHYLVDEHVVWRDGDWDGEPRDGKLLECRESA